MPHIARSLKQLGAAIQRARKQKGLPSGILILILISSKSSAIEAMSTSSL